MLNNYHRLKTKKLNFQCIRTDDEEQENKYDHLIKIK